MSFSNSGNASNKAAKVAHAWANQTRTEWGERGRETHWRIFFEGPTIYSYGRHFPIATIHNQDGRQAVLFTNRKNSLTTNKHIACAWDACSQYQRILCMDPVDAAQGDHARNLEDWESDAETKVNEIARARDKEARYNSILHYYNQAMEYCAYFNMTLDPERYPNLYFRPTPEAIAQLEAAKKVREAKERKAKAQEIEKWNFQLGYWRDFAVVKKETIEFQGKMYPAMEVDFRNKFPGADPMGFSYFRYNKETKRIETTQRIELPITAAKRFLTQLCPAICRGEIVTGAEIIGYTLLEANPQYIRVGCHKISVEEIKRQATQMGWEVC